MHSDSLADAVLSVTDFAGYSTVVDVAGVEGAFIAKILAAHPRMRGILFDQEHVIARAEEPSRAVGVSDRCRAVDGIREFNQQVVTRGLSTTPQPLGNCHSRISASF
jgi:hypothetical protein